MSVTVIVVGQINKDGSFEGVVATEHIVDGVYFFDGDRESKRKTVKCFKDRFSGGGERGYCEIQLVNEGAIDVLLPTPQSAEDGSAEASAPVVVPPVAPSGKRRRQPSAAPVATVTHDDVSTALARALVALLPQALAVREPAARTRTKQAPVEPIAPAPKRVIPFEEDAVVQTKRSGLSIVPVEPLPKPVSLREVADRLAAAERQDDEDES